MSGRGLYGCPLAGAQGRVVMLEGVCWLRTRQPLTLLNLFCHFIFALGNLAHFFQDGGREVAFWFWQGRARLEWLPAGPARVAFGAQVAGECPRCHCWEAQRPGRPGIAVCRESEAGRGPEVWVVISEGQVVSWCAAALADFVLETRVVVTAWGRVLLTSSEWRPEMLPSILLGAGTSQRVTQSPRESTVLPWGTSPGS